MARSKRFKIFNVATEDAIKWAEDRLKESGIESAGKEARELFMHSFGASREDTYLKEYFEAPKRCFNLFRQCVKLRSARYPLQYILKTTEFMGFSLKVARGLFIPRPETELLCEKVLEEIKAANRATANILDIGTGCGNIAISLTKNVTNCKIIGSDISTKALRTASGNAVKQKVGNRIKFIKSDLFSNLSSKFYRYFDIIVSNPPYIRRKDLATLEPEIRHEGAAALDGGDDGLCFYRRILKEGAEYLDRGGIFAFEIGYDQANDIIGLVKDSGSFSSPVFFKDYSGHDRVAIIRRNR